MADYNILTQDVPIGGTAVANLSVTDNGVADDMTSVRCVWKDNDGTTISDQTYSGTDISTTGLNGEAITITNPSGSGTYKATMVVDDAYELDVPCNFTLTVTVTDAEGSSAPKTFTFRVVASSKEVTLDTTSVLMGIRRRTGMLYEKMFVVDDDLPEMSGNYLSLGPGIVYGIDAAYKNGAVFSSGSTGDTYEWKTYRPNVKLNTDPAVNDSFLFILKTKMSDATVEDHITNVQRRVLSALAPHYDDASLATYPTVLGIIQDMVVGELRMQMAEGTALENAQYRSGRDLRAEATDHLRRIQQGKEAVRDWNGAIVSRRSHALIGGKQNANGAITERGDWWERMRDYQSTIFLPPTQAETS